MYTVIETSGFQQKVTLGEIIKVPKINSEVGSDVQLDTVLLVADGDDIKVGAPKLDGCSVIAEILNHGKEKKIKVFKKKRRKRYRRTQGHRQDFTQVVIKEFKDESGIKSADDQLIKAAKDKYTVAAETNEG